MDFPCGGTGVEALEPKHGTLFHVSMNFVVWGVEPPVLVEGKLETTPPPPNHQSKPLIRGKRATTKEKDDVLGSFRGDSP